MALKKVLGFLVIFVIAIYSSTTAVGQLTAGDFDDNLNFDHFLGYIESMKQSDPSQSLPDIDAGDRVTIRILDENEQGVSNAFVSITPFNSTSPIIETYSGTNGIFYFFPKIDGAMGQTKFNVMINPPDLENLTTSLVLDLDQLPEDRVVEANLESYTNTLPNNLDLMLVIDTTGSMSDELNYLTDEFKDIISTITQDYPQTYINFGLVVYRDEGDDYVVRTYEFTSSLNEMQQQLANQRSAGGGDYPEAMDQALSKAINSQWRDGNTARMLFLVADAPPHDDKLQATTDLIYTARQSGIHIFPLAASGVADTAEYIMRTASCLTHGRYLFLTDDSGIGNSHAEPHIPGYVVTHLDDLFVRVVGSELAGVRIEATEDEIIRTVGHVENGVVITDDDENTTTTNTTSDEGDYGKPPSDKSCDSDGDVDYDEWEDSADDCAAPPPSETSGDSHETSPSEVADDGDGFPDEAVDDDDAEFYAGYEEDPFEESYAAPAMTEKSEDDDDDDFYDYTFAILTIISFIVAVVVIIIFIAVRKKRKQ